MDLNILFQDHLTVQSFKMDLNILFLEWLTFSAGLIEFEFHFSTYYLIDTKLSCTNEALLSTRLMGTNVYEVCITIENIP